MSNERLKTNKTMWGIFIFAGTIGFATMLVVDMIIEFTMKD
jgi:hypothetical protein